jgi:hypothetical protein
MMLSARRARSWLLVTVSVAGAHAAASAHVMAGDIEQPTFRQGLWRFQRTIERIHGPSEPNSLLHKQQMVRCADPSVAMKAIFASPPVGKCVSSKPTLMQNRYVFAVRCDYMGPVRTEIIVDDDTSYIEVNELKVGKEPRRDVVIARRLGDCTNPAARREPPELIEAASADFTGHQLNIETVPAHIEAMPAR